MSDRSDPDNKLSPEAEEILKIILEDTAVLRSVELGSVPPATVPEVEG
jgi:hypothetical protein